MTAWSAIFLFLLINFVLVRPIFWASLAYMGIAVLWLVPRRARVTGDYWVPVGGLRRRRWDQVQGVIVADHAHPNATVRLNDGRDVDTGIPGVWAARIAEIGAVPLLERFPSPVYTGVVPDPEASHDLWAPPSRARTP